MKMLFFSFILVIIIGFLVIAGFSLVTDGVVFAGFLLFAIILFSTRSVFTADFGFVCFFSFRLDQKG
jgi:hypothetical protein